MASQRMLNVDARVSYSEGFLSASVRASCFPSILLKFSDDVAFSGSAVNTGNACLELYARSYSSKCLGCCFHIRAFVIVM